MRVLPLTTKQTQEYLDQLARAGCQLKINMLSGTMEVFDGETKVLMALEKGHDGPWIVSLYESDNIKWSDK